MNRKPNDDTGTGQSLGQLVSRYGNGVVTRNNEVQTHGRKGVGLAKGEQTRNRLIAAARQLLTDEGGERFSTRNVAAICGVSHGMCHYHFQDRTDLLVAVVEDIRPEWLAPFQEAVGTSGSFAERAERVLKLFAHQEADDLARLHAALHWFALDEDRIRVELDADYQSWRRCFVDLFQTLADERGDGLDPEPLGEATAAAADGLAAFHTLGAQVDAGLVMRTLIYGLAKGA